MLAAPRGPMGIGGIVVLWLSGEFLSVPASVGFIAPFGIAILNGVVLVSYFNQLSRQGYGLRQVILEGSRRRLRPVLMTAATTILGLLPLLFAEGLGSEIQRPLAIVVVGGLFSSTVLTLLSCRCSTTASKRARGWCERR